MSGLSRDREPNLRKEMLRNLWISKQALPSSHMSWSSDEDTSPLAGPTSSPTGAPATSPLSQANSQVRYFTIGKTSPSADREAAADAADEQRRQKDPRWQLRQRFKQCSTRSSNSQDAPDLEELQSGYGNASKEDLFYTIRLCAKWICYGARLSVSKGQDVEAAEALKKKWGRMDGPQVTEHMKCIVESRSIEDLRSMLADAFEDVGKRITEATGDKEDGFPIVKQGASVPDPAQGWY